MPCVDTLTCLSDPSDLYRLPHQLQKHGYQDLWTRLLQRMRRGAPNFQVKKMSELQQSIWAE